MTIEYILKLVTAEYGVRIEDVLTGGRKQNVVDARQMAMYLIYRRTGMTQLEIGKALNRSHPAVNYGIARTEDMLRFDPITKKHYEKIKKKLK